MMIPKDRLWFSLGPALFAVALLVRALGITWGLPNQFHNQTLHPDEPVIYGASRQVNPLLGDFDPGFYNYGTLYLSVLAVADQFSDAYSRPVDPKSETAVNAQIARHILVGRWISAFAGAGIVWLIYAYLRRLGAAGGAILAALAAAFAPGLVVHSRFQTVDMAAAFFVMASLYFSLRSIQSEGKEGMKLTIWAGVFAGLAAGTKYTGILAIASLLPLIRGENAKEGLKFFGAAFAASLVVFLITTPGAITNSAQFMRDFKYEALHTSTGHGLVFAGTSSGWIYHIGNLLAASGPIFLVLGLAGLVMRTLAKLNYGDERMDWNPRWLQGLLLFALLYYVLIARAEVKFLRYVFPLIPVFAIGFGLLVERAMKGHGFKSKFGVVLGFAAVGGIGGGGLAQTANYTLFMAGKDSRDAAGEYLRREEKSIGVVSDPWFYTPTIYPNTALPRPVPFELRDQIRKEAKPAVLQYIPSNPDERLNWDVRLLDELRPERVVYSSFESEDLERLAKKSDVPEEFKAEVDRYKAFMTRLTQDYAIDQTFGAGGPTIHDMMYIRPLIVIWTRKTASAPR